MKQTVSTIHPGSARLHHLRSIDLSSFIFAIDFDGTCVTHDFPEIGEDVEGAEIVLQALVGAGAKLMLWTVRSDKDALESPSPLTAIADDYLKHAVLWFEQKGIPLWSANINHGQSEWSVSPKAYAHVYIDDAALGCPLVFNSLLHSRPFVDWSGVLDLLVDRFHNK